MAVPPLSPTMIRRILKGGYALEPDKEPPMEHLAHPLANIAFEIAGLIGLLAIWRTIKEMRRG